MKIALTSDLHIPGHKIIDPISNETIPIFNNSFDVTKLDVDVLLVAGDFAYTTLDVDTCLNYLKSRIGINYKHLLYVYGNHDYYFSFKHPNDYPNYLEQEIDNVVFLGCTMWSPVYNNKILIEHSINDYNYVFKNTTESNICFNTQSNWLYEKIKYYTKLGKDIVICTHHMPFKECISEQWKNSDINAAFCIYDIESPFYDFKNNTNIKFWHFGHTHNNVDTMVGNIHCIANPVGYKNEKPYSHHIIEI